MKFWALGVQRFEWTRELGHQKNWGIEEKDPALIQSKYVGAKTPLVVLQNVAENAQVREFSDDNDTLAMWGKSLPDDEMDASKAVNAVIWLTNVWSVFYHVLPDDVDVDQVLSAFWYSFSIYISDNKHWLENRIHSLVKVKVVKRKRTYGHFASPTDPTKIHEFNWLKFEVSRKTYVSYVRDFLATWTYNGQTFLDLAEVEINNDPELQVMDRIKSTFCRWLQVDDTKCTSTVLTRVYGSVEVKMDDWIGGIAPMLSEDPKTPTQNPDVWLASVDCETWFHNVDVVPRADLGKNAFIFSLATSFFKHNCKEAQSNFVQFMLPKNFHIEPTAEHQELIDALAKLMGGEDERWRYMCQVLRDRLKAKNVIPLFFTDEQSLFDSWRDVIVRINPDVITGYNLKMYDLKFIFERTCKAAGRGHFFSRSIGIPCSFKLTQFDSGAAGQNDTATYSCPFRIILEMLDVIKGEHKLHSFKLDDVATEFLKVGKEYIGDHIEIHNAYERGNIDDVEKLIMYNLNDTHLVGWLAHQQQTMNKSFEMGAMTYNSPHNIVTRGKQIQVFHSLVLRCHAENRVLDLPTLHRKEEDKYEGGAVHDAVRGFYADFMDKALSILIFSVVATLDFASLYPSIMRTFNLCYTTLLIQSAALHELMRKALNQETLFMSEALQCFTQEVTGVLPQANKEWAEKRKAIKRRMETVYANWLAETDAARKTELWDLHCVLDASQNACKLVMNSSYGFTGVSEEKAIYPCWAVALSVTLCGRTIIHETEDQAHESRRLSVITADGEPFECLLTHDREVMLKSDAEADGFVTVYVNVIYGDTDSIMPNLQSKVRLTDAQIFAMGNAWTKAISVHFQSKFSAMGYKDVAISLTFEKFFRYYGLLGKKMYFGLKYVENKLPKKHVAGFASIRKDKPKLTRDLCSGMMDCAMSSGGRDAALKLLWETLEKLLKKEFDIADYVITVKLGRDYDAEHEQKAAHVAAQMSEFEEVVSGQRLAYVLGRLERVQALTPFPAIEALRALCTDVAVAPRCLAMRFVKDLNDIDRRYYVKQLRNPVGDLLSIMGYSEPFIDRVFQYYEDQINAQMRLGSTLSNFLGGTGKPLHAHRNPFELLAEGHLFSAPIKRKASARKETLASEAATLASQNALLKFVKPDAAPALNLFRPPPRPPAKDKPKAKPAKPKKLLQPLNKKTDFAVGSTSESASDTSVSASSTLARMQTKAPPRTTPTEHAMNDLMDIMDS